MNREKFLIQLSKKTKETENIVLSYLPEEEGFQKEIMKAMNYSVEAGGKRLRPLLMKETFDFYEGNGKSVEAFMAAIEFIHTYSLVHDDLPSMDNDKYRRGKLTTHAKFGEAMGVLAGDALLNYAVETALKGYDIDNSEAFISALQYLMSAAGIFGMIGGQVIDIKNENNSNISKDILDEIYRLKTGALLMAAMVVGAILAGVNKEEKEQVEKVAYNIGMAFQIQDDILDVTSTVEELGKPIGSDDKNHKVTYVTLFGLEKAKEYVNAYSKEAILGLEEMKGKNSFLNELVEYLIDRKN
ncbi:MAG: polyprenyl synthetase family protein [Lachnospiraceae bacterium]|jgi:geranylgeranyl diphosphate synthase type II|nr:polyprenyl synthetase family protein [Lachnospiraceae bacterium]